MKNAIVAAILGFCAGVLACFVVVVHYNLSPVKIGRQLDEDIIFLKNGNILRGQILDKRADEIIVETKNGSVTFKTSECLSVHENNFMQYLRKAS